VNHPISIRIWLIAATAIAMAKSTAIVIPTVAGTPMMAGIAELVAASNTI
jgi:hypothetical protein